MKHLVFSFYLTFVLVSSAFGCRIALEPLKKFDAKENIFYGEVIGFTELYEEKDRAKSEKTGSTSVRTRNQKVEVNEAYRNWQDKKIQALGLKIRILRSIYTPDVSGDFVEVLPFSLMDDCRLQGRYSTEASISKNFPIGSKIVAVGTKSTMFPTKNGSDTKRIDIGIFNILSRFENQTKEFSTDGDYEVDYRKQIQLPKFELKKDLFRLEFSRSETEIIQILERLSAYPEKYVSDMDYEIIVRNYLSKSRKEIIENLLKLRRDFVETLKQKQ